MAAAWFLAAHTSGFAGLHEFAGARTNGGGVGSEVLDFAEQAAHAKNKSGARPSSDSESKKHSRASAAKASQAEEREASKANEEDKQPEGMLCWLVTMSEGVELELVRDHYRHNRSVFACDEHTIFSDTADLSPVVATDLGALRSSRAPWGGWYNTLVFLHAWDILAKEGKFARRKWSVKVDADSVFFPSRLWSHLHGAVWSKPMYLKGGKMLLGAVEVFSNAAVHAFAKRGAEVCTEDIEVSGEDGFINSCMRQLGVHPSIDPSLLKSTTNVQDCANGRFVAFHPFVSVDSFDACFKLATR